MSNSLWPENIQSRVLSPMAILRMQAEALSGQTNAMLLGDTSHKEEDGRVILHLDIVVPLLNGYRHRILNVAYRKELPYPVIVFNGPLSKSRAYKAFLEFDYIPTYEPEVASNEDDLKSHLASIFKSDDVVIIAQSLLARATDVLDGREQQEQADSAAEAKPPDNRVGEE